MTERTDFQTVEELEDPDDPDDPEDPDDDPEEPPEEEEPPWEDVDLDGAGAFVGDVSLSSPGVVEALGDFVAAGVRPSGVGASVFDGEAKESSPGPSAPSDAGSFASFVRTGSSGCLSVTTIAVAHTATVVRASAPASQSRRVPGARELSGFQPFSQELLCGGGGWDVLSGMRCSSSGAHGDGLGRENQVSER
ncbi:hypothetical protein ACIRU8_34305 [Streptomyces sp. NPDC101175]|uniref:hypothetical protein n=1 Tax=Streptomyces sp. NPDC101175 TaxID=3366123 RepID=UPI003837A0B9